MTTEIEPGMYEHFKGGRYQVLFTGLDTETVETLVIYSSLQAKGEYPVGTVWVRSLRNFSTEIDRYNYKGPRFKKLDQ